MISTRGQKMIGEPSPLVVAHFQCADDKFHPSTNPNGKINFGTAENHLMNAEVLAMLNQPLHYTAHDFHYDQPHGTQSFRTAIANYMEKIIGISDVNPENIAVASGASAIQESLSMALFEEGEGLVIPAPLYTGFIHDFSTRFNVKIVPHLLRANNQYQLEVDELKATIEQALDDSIPVRAILLCSPNNPLGITYSEQTLAQVVQLAKAYKLEIISDEIYAKSVYHGQFRSMLEIGKDYREHIHMVYGFAKDLALSGFKTGILYSENRALVTAVSEIAFFHTVSTHTQHFLENLITNQTWCQAFIEKNNTKLQTAYNTTKILFEEELNVNMVEANAGIFVWANFSNYLETPTFAAELNLFEKLFNECGVSISPGQFFMDSTPGWFRVCFAQELVNLETAVQRMKDVLK